MKFYEMPETCYVCHVEGMMAHHHMIPGKPGRKLSERYNAVVPICPVCHGFIHSSAGVMKLREIRKDGQLKVMSEQGWTEEEFRKHFGKSYL